MMISADLLRGYTDAVILRRLADEVRAWHETREVLNRLLEEEKEV